MLFWGKMPLKMRIWGVFEVNLPNLPYQILSNYGCRIS